MHKILIACVSVLFLLFFGCVQPVGQGDDVYGAVAVGGGDDGLVTDLERAVLLDEEGFAPGAKPVETFEYNITEISRIRPPTVNGHPVQANDIVISGNTAYVAYNTAGPVFDGAVQIIRINGRKLRFEREIAFASMDVITLNLQGDKLYFGGMADPDVFDGRRSFIGVIDLYNPKARNIADSLVWLNSFAATGIAVYSDEFFVSVGAADGGVEILGQDMVPLAASPAIEADDIRDIEEYSGGVIALAGTTDSVAENGRILIIKNGVVTREITIEDFDSPEAKATLEVNGGYAYLGLSAKGFQVCDLSNENVLLTFPNPDADPLHVTNSVSFEDDLIFSANGEYGFRVLRYVPADASAVIVGYYGFQGLTDGYGQNYSANHVEYRNKYLFVASGAGGLSAYQLSVK